MNYMPNVLLRQHFYVVNPSPTNNISPLSPTNNISPLSPTNNIYPLSPTNNISHLSPNSSHLILHLASPLYIACRWVIASTI